MPLIQLIYCSRIAVPAAALAHTMDHLFVAASARNKVNGVTGCLAYNTQWFIQVIEGETMAVDGTYDRIALDRRHAQIKLMNRREIRGRSFPDWHMAGIRLSDQPDSLLEAHGIGAHFDPEKVLCSQLLLLLMELADRKRMASRQG